MVIAVKGSDDDGEEGEDEGKKDKEKDAPIKIENIQFKDFPDDNEDGQMSDEEEFDMGDDDEIVLD